MKSPDYKDIPQEAAVTDFLSRIHQYEKRYETIDDKSERNYSFIKIFNCGERFLVHKIGGTARPARHAMHRCLLSGHIQSRVVYFLMNIHILPRTIYLTRVSDATDDHPGFHWETFQHGESELNQQQRIGGDPPLSTNGKQVGQHSLSLLCPDR